MRRKRNWPTVPLTVIMLLCCHVVQAEDIWFVDTRGAQVTPDGGIGYLNIERRAVAGQGAVQWSRAGMAEFLQDYDPEKPTIIMVHGNLMTRPEARQHGLAFQRFAGKAGSFRLVIWCWPSEKQQCRVRPDAQSKAVRADRQAAFLAAFLKEIERARPGGKISIPGFSYGAKVTCGALDLLARDRQFQGETGPVNLRIRPVLLAAAMDCQSLAMGGRYGRALSVTDEMLVHVNPDDKTLRFYPMLWKLHGPQAVGKEGVWLGGIASDQRSKIRSVNVRRLLGEDHGCMKSLLGFVAQDRDFRRFALFE